MIDLKKIFLILFCMISASAGAQLYTFQTQRILGYGFILSEDMKSAEEKARLSLMNNKVEEIYGIRENGDTTFKVRIDRKGRALSFNKNDKYKREGERRTFEYNYDNELTYFSMWKSDNSFIESEIRYEGNKPVYSRYDAGNSRITTSRAEYNGDTLVRVRMDAVSPGDSTQLVFKVKYAQDTILFLPDLEILYWKRFDKQKSIFTLISKPDTALTIEGTTDQKFNYFFSNNNLVRTEADVEGAGVVYQEFYYKENGLMDYAVSTQKIGVSEGRTDFHYVYYED